MPKAFIMIDDDPGHEKDVIGSVKRIAGVKFIYEVTGEHDMIALVDSIAENDIGAIVSSIRKLPGIKDTTTELVLGE